MARPPVNGEFTQETLNAPVPKVKGPLQSSADLSLSGSSGYTFSDTAAQRDAMFQDLQRQDDTYSTGQQSFVAGVHNSLLGSMYDAFTQPDFAPQSGYTPDMTSLSGWADRPASEDEARAMRGAVSPDDLSARWAFVQENRKRQQQMADNPVAAITGTLLGDAPLLALNIGAGAVASGLGRAGVVAGETAASALEAGGATYAYSRNPNVHAADIILPALSVAGGGLLGLRSIRKADGVVDSVSDAEGIMTRQSRDISGVGSSTVSPVKVQPGEVWAGTIDGNAAHAFMQADSTLSTDQRTLLQGMNVDSDLKVRISADTTKPAQYNASTHTVTVGLPHSAKGSTVNSLADAMKLMDGPAKQTLMHELVHASTVRRLQSSPAMRESVQKLQNYAEAELSGSSKFAQYFTSPEEFVAGLADPAFNRALQRLELPKELTSSFMAGGEKVAKNASEALSQAFSKHIATGAEKDASLNLMSDTFYDLNSVRANTAEGETRLFNRMFQKIGEATGLTKHLSLYDRVAYSGEKGKSIADRLFANGSAVGTRQDSAADQLRLLQVQAAPDVNAVQDRVREVLMSQGVSRKDIALNRPSYRIKRQQLNERVTQFMDNNSNAFFRGEPPAAVPEDIQGIVDALQNFSKNWRERLKDSTLSDGLPENPWYIPRRYEYSNVRKLMQEQGVTRNGVRDLFRQAMRDAYPSMDTELSARVAQNIEEGIWASGSSAQRRTWQEALGVDQLEEAMRRTGMSDEDIESILNNRVKGSAGAPVRNLRGRTQLDTSARYVVEGKAVSLQDLMQTDVVGLLDGYAHSMSGRLALDRVGIKSPRALQDEIDAASAEVPVQDVQNWGRAIDDGMNQILGIGEQTPQLMRVLQNFASATMLKNSGLYQVVDTMTAVYERGLGNWMKALNKEPWSKELANSDVVKRMSYLLESGTLEKDAKFRWLQSQMVDRHQYTKADSLEVLSTNAAQAAMTMNGLRRVTQMQGSLNSRIIINTLLDMLEGDPKAVKYMQETGGLSADEIAQMQRLHKANPGAAFEDAKLRNRFENAGLRLQDTLTQQNRIGEVPAWATSTAAGRVLVGFTKFALAAHNKITRRVLRRDGMYGLMVLAAYQVPLMLMVQTVRQAREGNNPFSEETQTRILSDTAVNLSAFGVIPFLNDVITGQGQFSNPAISWGQGFVAAPGRIVNGADPVKVATQSLPLLGLLPVKAASEAGKAVVDE